MLYKCIKIKRKYVAWHDSELCTRKNKFFFKFLSLLQRWPCLEKGNIISVLCNDLDSGSDSVPKYTLARMKTSLHNFLPTVKLFLVLLYTACMRNENAD